MTIASATTANTLATLTDNGTLTFATGDTVSLANTQPNNYYDSQIVVGSGGLLNATGTAFNASGIANGTAYTQIVVQLRRPPPGQHQHLRPRPTQPQHRRRPRRGRPVRQRLQLPLYIPAIDVQYLSGTSNNLQFQTIYIQPDTLANGQSVALNMIGTQNTSNLRYVFPGNFTINQGASLAVGPNVAVTIGGRRPPTPWRR